MTSKDNEQETPPKQSLPTNHSGHRKVRQQRTSEGVNMVKMPKKRFSLGGPESHGVCVSTSTAAPPQHWAHWAPDREVKTHTHQIMNNPCRGMQTRSHSLWLPSSIIYPLQKRGGEGLSSSSSTAPTHHTDQHGGGAGGGGGKSPARAQQAARFEHRLTFSVITLISSLLLRGFT